MLDIMIDQNTFAKQLGRRIADYRKLQGLSQAQLAEIVDCSQQMIGDYETGRRRIPAYNLAAIADALSVSVADLLEGNKMLRSKRGPLSKMERQISQVRRLPKSKQRFVSELLDNVLSQAHS